MDANSVSPLWYRRVTLQGKFRRRVQDLRIPSSPSLDFLASSRPPLDLSHNESARLAADCLLSCGMGGYQEALKAEGEVDFLSELEKKYFLENGKDSNTNAEPDGGDGSDNGFESSSSSSHSVTPCPSESKDSDSTEAGVSSKEDGNVISRSNESNVEVYLYTENRAAGLKDVVREFIRKAEKSLAVVTDHFSDVELLCDLLEASKKRFVSVQLFLDHLNLSIFRDMWQELKLQGKDFPKFSAHSVEGQTYCAKTGRKLSGQVSETFIITDSTEALTGSFSFSCLSWMVHRTLIFFVKGSAVSHFLEEFERLSSCSRPVTGFNSVSLSLPFKTSSYTKNKEQKGEVRSNHTDMVRIRDWIEDGLNSHKKERTQNNIVSSQYSRPLRQPLMQHMCMQKFTKPTLGGIPAQDHTKTKGDILHRHNAQTKSKLQTNLAAFTHSPRNGLHPGTTGPAHSTSALWAHHRQDKAVGSSTQNKDFSKGRYSFKCEEHWTQKHHWATITPPGIAAGFNKCRRERNTPQRKSNHADNSKVTPSFMSLEKQCVQSAMKGAWGETYRLQTTTSRTKVQDQPQRHHILQSQTQTRSPTTSISTQPKESKLFFPERTVRQAALEKKAPQQVKPSSRLAWMTQTTMRDRPMARQSSFSSYDTVHKLDGQNELRQFHPTSAKPLTRSQSVTERPQTRTHLK